MDYAVANGPMETTEAVPRREPVVRSAVDRLEKLAAESDELVERLQSTFSPVLFHVPQDGEAMRESDAIHGSDLGQALMRIAERIDISHRAIREVIESADV
jgi:hypothetical protein